MISDIKDRTPNQGTIGALEKLLEQAKSGELRTIIYVVGYDDDDVSHGWAVDRRNSRRRLVGEMACLQYDILTGVSLDDGDTVLAQQFSDKW